MKSIGIIDAFWQEISRKTVWIKNNPLYWVMFLFVFSFMGTIGLWGEHAFVSNKRNWNMFIDNLSAINLTTYSAPILTAIVSDWILKIFTQSKTKLTQGKKTFYFLVFILTMITILLMLLGLSSGARNYSKISLLSVGMLLLIYLFSYCENSLYEDKGEPSAISTNNIDPTVSTLQGGGLK